MFMNASYYFKTLSDETRIRLLNILRVHEMSVNELVTLMEMGQPRISRHLKILADAGFLGCRRDGVWAFYGLGASGPARQLLDAVWFLFASDERLLQDLEKARQLVEDRKTRARRFFNSIAPDWELLKQKIMGGFDLNGALLDMLPSCDTLLDLGCGTGDFLELAGNCAKKSIGVDSSAKMLEIARQRFKTGDGRPELRLGELEHLPLRDGEADCVVISMVLHHVPEPDAVITEIGRVLKPGGTLLVAELEKHANEEMRKKFGDRWLGFSRREMSALLENHGFVLRADTVRALQPPLNVVLYNALKK